MNFKTISIIGLGYIGLPTAAVFASSKIKVIGVDVNQKTVDTINRGQIHIVEPDLEKVVHAAVTDGYLRATTQPEPAEVFLSSSLSFRTIGMGRSGTSGLCGFLIFSAGSGAWQEYTCKFRLRIPATSNAA